MSGLTHVQAACIRFISSYTSENEGACPSFEEMRAHLGFASKATVARLLDRLEEKGKIVKRPNKWRSIEVVPDRRTEEALKEFSMRELREEIQRRHIELAKRALKAKGA